MNDQTLTEDLLRRMQKGDDQARERLFDRYQPRILGMVRVMLGSHLRRRVDSGDIAQDAMLEAIHRLEGFEPRGPGSVLAWLRTLVRSAICAESDRGRARKRDAGPVQSLQPAVTGEIGVDPPSDGTQAMDRLEHGEANKQLEQCLAELPEADRDLILLRNYAEQSWEEIAREVGRASANAARVAYGEAKARLAILLQRRQSGAAGEAD